MRERTVSLKYEYSEMHGIYRISVFPTRLFYLQIERIKDEILEQTIAIILAFADAVNFNGTTYIETKFPVPKYLAELFGYYNEFEEDQNVVFKNVADDYQFVEEIENKSNAAIMLSGGKDSTYMLLKTLEKYNNSDIIAGYVAGTTVNAEFFPELYAVRKITKMLNVKPKVINIWHADYTETALNFYNRTRWRDLLFLAVARTISKEIVVGETYDLGRFSTIDNLKEYPRRSIYFSGTKLAYDFMAKILNAKIITAPSELEIYRYMSRHRPDLFKLTRSCYNPMKDYMTKCDPKNDWEHACSKCKTFFVYDLILDGIPLSSREISFVLSDRWVGMSKIKQYVSDLVSKSKSLKEIVVPRDKILSEKK